MKQMIRKQDVATFFDVYKNEVVESCGNPIEGDRRLTLTEALQVAREFHKKGQHANLQKLNKVSKAYLFGKTIRSFFSKKTRKDLQEHKAALLAAKISLDEEPSIKIRYLPDELPFEGSRYVVGSKIWRVDTYNGNMKEFTITEEDISFFNGISNTVSVCYACGSEYGFSSVGPYYFNHKIFTDKSEAITFSLKVINSLIDKLQNTKKEVKNG